MSFQDVLKSGKFIVTTDIVPPKGIDVSHMLDDLEPLRGRVDGINVPELPSAVMKLGSLPLSCLLKQKGFEPIMQMTCRDRNRLSLQSDLLGAYVLGIRNILALTGDAIELSDDPEAKAVFDLDSIELLEAAKKLEQGFDMAGKKLKGSPQFCTGAAADHLKEPLEPEIEKIKRKVAVGAQFIQTQPVYDLEAFIDFYQQIKYLNVPVLAGLFILKSAKMARFINKNIPGMYIPENVIINLEKANNAQEKSIEITAKLAKKLQGITQGVHIMSIGLESKVPLVLDLAGL